MLRSFLTDRLCDAISGLVDKGELPAAVRDVPVELSDTKNPEHGDFSCNFAMAASKAAGMNPRQIGEKLADALGEGGDEGDGGEVFASVEVAGPGFLNLKLNPEFVASYVKQILALGAELPKTQIQAPKSINVEFVSVNPNGPITVGSARGAAFGDAICRVFEAVGHKPYREYYVNDGVNSEQMRQFAMSVRAHALGEELPEKAYRGEYVQDVAHAVVSLKDNDGFSDDATWWQQASQALMIERQRGDLELFGVHFDKWYSEQALHNSGGVQTSLDKLQSQGNAYYADKPATGDDDPDDELTREEAEHPNPHADPEAFADDSGTSTPLPPSPSTAQDIGASGGGNQGESAASAEVPGRALWLRSSAFSDDKDRVLVRGDGRPAYIAADVAYMENKLGERGFDKAIIVLGPDHHGYIGRMNAVCQALGYPLERFEIIIFQVVRFVKEGKPAPMRKRDGNIYELRDLIIELGAAAAPSASREEQQRVGADVARFFYLMRSHDTHMDFDIDLATKQSDENPVFYVQYAHARICSVIRKAEEAGFRVQGLGSRVQGTGSGGDGGFDASLLTHPRETALIKKILDLPWEVRRCAEDYGVHRLTTYAQELARIYHLFYDACRVIQPDQPDLTRARLALCEAARICLKATFDLLGISAPEKMEREAQPVSPDLAV